jgi:multidrug resistance efflux pump
MKRGALFLLPTLAVCHCAPATRPPGEVWIPPRQAEEATTVATTVPTRRVVRDDVETHGTLEKARADLIAAERDLERQQYLCRQCGGLCGHDVDDAYDRYRQAKAELERAEARARLRR